MSQGLRQSGPAFTNRGFVSVVRGQHPKYLPLCPRVCALQCRCDACGVRLLTGYLTNLTRSPTRGSVDGATNRHNLGEHVMNYSKVYSLILISALAEHPAQATQPPDVVQSDSSRNTAMGTSALLNLDLGTDNTAVGWIALN